MPNPFEYLNATLGLSTDAEATGNGTLTAILKRLRTLLNGGLPGALGAGGGLKIEGVAGGVAQPASVADGADVTQGAVADAAVTTNTTGTVSAKLRGLVALMVDFLSRFPAALAANGGLKVEGVAGGVTIPISDTWTPSLQAEETADDSDKTFTVPASIIWAIQSIWVELTTTATVGARQIEIMFTDGSDDVIGVAHPAVTQAASLTYNYMFGLGLPDLQVLRDSTYLQSSLPMMYLPAGYKIRIRDNNAVAAAADDMVVQMMVLSKAV